MLLLLLFGPAQNMITELHQDNNEKPVVIMTHSMGCKVAHYFLNWVKSTVSGGQVQQPPLELASCRPRLTADRSCLLRHG